MQYSFADTNIPLTPHQIESTDELAVRKTESRGSCVSGRSLDQQKEMCEREIEKSEIDRQIEQNKS